MRDCLTNFSRNEQKLTTDLSTSSFVNEDDSLCILAEDYLTVSKQLGDSAKTFSDILQQSVCDPLKIYGNEFGSVQAAIKKRDQQIADLLPVRSRLEKQKERERTGNNIVRAEQLKRSLSTMENEFKATNKQLQSDMNVMLELKPEYVEPSFLALIRAETNYYGECTKLFNSLVQSNSLQPNSRSPNQRIDKFVEPPPSELISQFFSDMQAIRALSIVADK